MTAFHPAYVIDENHNKTSVLLSIGEWEEIVRAIEELADIRAYDDAKRLKEAGILFESDPKPNAIRTIDPMRYSHTVDWPMDGMDYQRALRDEWG
ncbi:MAG: hypothetical protein KJO08_06530 [Gammaproteobacteria bacterium]|nr:hypothetical protein [Gammaproteobacteria bacterium]NNJ84052.1 hypothetical protein [Gammaproteobacteria bacterium]